MNDSSKQKPIGNDPKQLHLEHLDVVVLSEAKRDHISKVFKGEVIPGDLDIYVSFHHGSVEKEILTVEKPLDVDIVCGKQRSRKRHTTIRLPRMWELFPYLLPKTTRLRVYEPAYNDILHDYLLSRKYKTEGAKRWLTFCFCVRTVGLIFGSLRAMVGAKCWAVIEKILPEWIRQFWSK
jgi:hypothetical protein